MAVYDDVRTDAPCALCGAQADDVCDGRDAPGQGMPCDRALCWGCAVVSTDECGGVDVWCPEHAASEGMRQATESVA